MHTFRENCEILSEGFFVKIFIIFHKNNNMQIANYLSCIFFIVSFFLLYPYFLYFCKSFVVKKKFSYKNPRTFYRKVYPFSQCYFLRFSESGGGFFRKKLAHFSRFCQNVQKKSRQEKKQNFIKKYVFYFFIFFTSLIVT